MDNVRSIEALKFHDEHFLPDQFLGRSNFGGKLKTAGINRLQVSQCVSSCLPSRKRLGNKMHSSAANSRHLEDLETNKDVHIYCVNIFNTRTRKLCR